MIYIFYVYLLISLGFMIIQAYQDRSDLFSGNADPTYFAVLKILVFAPFINFIPLWMIAMTQYRKIEKKFKK